MISAFEGFVWILAGSIVLSSWPILVTVWMARTEMREKVGDMDDSNTPKIDRKDFWAAALIVSAIALFLILVDDVFAAAPPVNARFLKVVAVVFLLSGWGYFTYVVLVTLYLCATVTTYDSDAVRLARSTAVSVIVNVMSAALLYDVFGLYGPGCTAGESAPCGESGPTSAVYFSMVTFSTLGYGDFQPAESIRLLAAGQAIIGNLHLGIFVGLAITSMSSGPSEDET